MILEIATLTIRPEQEANFERVFAVAQQYIAAVPGYRNHTLNRCLEQSGRYALLVEWDSVEAHTVGFRQSAEFQQWRELLHPFYETPPEVLHYSMV